MSIAIQIVDLAANGIQPAASLSALWEQIVPLLEEDTVPSPKYVEFARNLEARMRQGKGKPLALASVQKRLDYPLEQATTLTTAAWPYGLPDDEGRFSSAHVLHALVLEAMKLDLLVFADPFGVAFLPGGRVISQSADAGDWAALLEEASAEDEAEMKPALSRSQMIKRVLGMLEAKLGPHGFALSKEKMLDSDGKPEKDVYYLVKEVPQGWQHFKLVTGKSGSHGLTIMLSSGGFNRLMHPTLLSLFPGASELRLQPPYAEDYGIEHLYLSEFIDARNANIATGQWPEAFKGFPLPVQPGQGPFAELALSQYLDLLLEVCLPVLERFKDLRGFWRAYVQQDGKPALDERFLMVIEFRRAALVAGHLLGDPGVDRLADTVIRYIRSAALSETQITRQIQDTMDLLHKLRNGVPRLPENSVPE